MPHHLATYNHHLTIKVARDRREALLQQIQGPERWVTPIDGQDAMDTRIPMSAHSTLTIEAILNGIDAAHRAQRSALIADFLAQEPHPRPAWMPVARYELRSFWHGLHHPAWHTRSFRSDTVSVALSCAVLSPLKNRCEFDQFFPGQVDAQGFWALHPGWKTDSLAIRHQGHTDLCRDRLGIILPPDPDTMNVYKAQPVDEDNVRILVRFVTDPGLSTTVTTMLQPVLAAYDAQAITIWTSDHKQSGYVHVAPNAGVMNTGIFPMGMFSSDHEGFTSWDHARLAQAVVDQAQPGFTPRFV